MHCLLSIETHRKSSETKIYSLPYTKYDFNSPYHCNIIALHEENEKYRIHMWDKPLFIWVRSL